VVLFCIGGVALWGLPFYYDFMVQQFGWSVQLMAVASIWRPKPTISRVVSATQPHKGN